MNYSTNFMNMLMVLFTNKIDTVLYKFLTNGI